MRTKNRNIFLLQFIVSCILKPHFFGDAKVVVKKLENCEQNENYKLNINVTFKTIGDKQYVDGTLILKTPLDNHIRGNASVEIFVGTRYVYLLSINERKGCDALNKFFGEFWYDIERCVQIIPGICPLPMGKHQAHSCLLNFDKLTTVNNFPFGQLRFTTTIDDKNNNIFGCTIAELENLL